MARKPQVTRTIKSIEASVLCVSTETRETLEQTFTLSGKIADKEKMLKAVEQMCDEGIKPVSILDVTEKECLYGMSEEDFVKYAKVLPPRGQNETE